MTSEAASPARWDRGHLALELVEQSTARASDAIASALRDEQWRSFGLTLRKGPGDVDWTVRAGDTAGIVRLEIEGATTQLKVTPKIEGLDMFFLADWAYSPNKKSAARLQNERAELAPLRAEPAACLLGWYVSELLSFATRWLRRGHAIREEEVIGRVRGRIDVARYLARSVAHSRPHSVPIRYAEPTHDTALNRYLKAGLRRVAVLAQALPIAAARAKLNEMIRRALSLFAGVADVTAHPREALRFNLSGPFRSYVPVVQSTTAVLEGSYVSFAIGEHSQQAIMWSLNRLYEQALGNVLDSWPGASPIRVRARATLLDAAGLPSGSTAVMPDYLMRRADGVSLVIDAKYKDVHRIRGLHGQGDDEGSISLAPSRRQRVRVRRADVYQVVAYSHHSEIAADIPVLVYPVALDAGEQYPAAMQVKEFGPRCNIVFFDVGPNATANLSKMYDALESL